MNDRVPHTERDHVLVDVKAEPSGWPPASLDPDSGRGPQATSGTPAPTRSTISGLYGFRGLPIDHLISFGYCHFAVDDYPKAIALHEQALTIAREVGDREGESAALVGLGICHDASVTTPRPSRCTRTP